MECIQEFIIMYHEKRFCLACNLVRHAMQYTKLCVCVCVCESIASNVLLLPLLLCYTGGVV
jgi:hypothetical protein